MKKILSLVLVLALVALVSLPALADGSTKLSNDDTSVITISADEWQGDEMYFLVEVHTGVNTTKDFEIIIPDGFVAIIECFDLDGVGDGHLIAYDGDQTIDATVTNGFVGLCTDKAAKELFTERWTVLETNDWARKDVQPLDIWDWAKPTTN